MLRFITAATIALGIIATPAAAQDYPNKPIKMLVGYAQGGGSESALRPRSLPASWQCSACRASVS